MKFEFLKANLKMAVSRKNIQQIQRFECLKANLRVNSVIPLHINHLLI